MDSFTEAYSKARSVVQSQHFKAGWSTFLNEQVKLKSLLAADGPDPLFAHGLTRLREKLIKEPEGKRGAAICAACKIVPTTGSVEERAATLKLLWHLYRSRKRGGQDVWIYSPPKDFATWVYAEIAGAETGYLAKLDKTAEVYSPADQGTMCDALAHALAATQKACLKLGALDAATTAAVRSWFADENTSDAQIAEAVKTLLDGYKKLSNVLNSTTLVFSDEPLDRNAGGWKDWAFVRPTEKMNVVYIQGAFLKAAGSTGRLWICVETIIHELSHRALGTEDFQYDYKGLKPSKDGLTFAKALNNADTWGYFCVDVVGMLSAGDRTKTLKRA